MKKLLLFLFSLPLFVLSQVAPGKPLNYVTDSANVLSQEEENLLNHKLHLFQDSTSSQVFIFVASSLEGRDLFSYSQEIFNKWDIGQKGKHNGILMAIFIDDHKHRIHTGYGMEGILPDLRTKKIQDEEMRPSFKEKKYYEGINKGIDQLIYYSKHQFKAEAPVATAEDSFWGFVILYVAAGVVFCLNFLLIRFVFKERKAGKISMWIIAGVIFLIPFLGLIILCFMLFVMGIIALVKVASSGKPLFGENSKIGRSWGKSFTYGSGNTYNSDNDSSWISFSSSSSSSSSDSSYSGSSSDSSFSGGGGGESGGGGSSSDW